MTSRPRLVTAALVHTMKEGHDHGGPCDALVVAGDRIVAAGSAAVLKHDFPTAERVAHPGAVIVPGFNDAHQHLIDVAAATNQIDAGATEIGSDARRIIAAVERAAAACAVGEWIQCYRYDDTTIEGPAITRDDLDRAAPLHPVLLIHISDHWAVLNTPALHRAGLPTCTERIGSADLFRIAWSDQAVVDKPSTTRHIQQMGDLARRYAAAGITSIGDALVSPRQVATYRRAQQQRALGLRVTMLIDAQHAREYLERDGIGSGWGDEWLRIGGFKAFVDGAVAAGTCLLGEPYEDSSRHGDVVADLDELSETFRLVHDAGSVMAVHANGDRAIELLLDIAQAAGVEPGCGPLHRIEHCSVLTPRLVRRIAATGMAVVPFGAYISSHGAKLEAWYGGSRLEGMFAHRWLLDAGIPTGGSSDYSASPFEPLRAIQTMVTRTSEMGHALGVGQRITPYEALHVYTVGSARVAGEATYKGALAPGHLADYVVLGADPLQVSATEIADIPVLQTTVGGSTTWTSDT